MLIWLWHRNGQGPARQLRADPWPHAEEFAADVRTGSIDGNTCADRSRFLVASYV